MRVSLLLLLIPAVPAFGARPEFNRDVRPILSDRCFACHGPDRASRKSDLRLDLESSAKAVQKSKHIGIVPGDPARSEVYRRITSTNKGLRMPPAYLGHDALPQAEIEIIKRWIEEGAEYQPFWSLIPPKRAPLPEVSDPAWVRNPIDRFILAKLDREHLRHSPEADRSALLRRVTLDLTGLPPTSAELADFLRDTSPGAYEKVVDRLLASPRYGERMAVRWLEAARYADTNGYQSDGPRDMWRWRDWVIDAFNRNMPFDEFTVDQIAGDLLPNPTLAQRIATAFNRNHRTSAEGGIVDEEFRVEYVADRVETTSTVWLGLTVGCARCHDHKYDPITQKEFYQLFAFFNNVPEKGFVYNFGNEEPYIKAPLPGQQKRLDEFDRALAALHARLSSLDTKSAKAESKWERGIRKRNLDWDVTAGLQYQRREAALFDGKDFITAGKDIAQFNYRDPFTFAAWIKPDSDKGAIISRSEDYFEGQGHGLYVLDGKIRLHVIFRWTDLGMRVETADRVRLHQWQHVLVTYDGSMKAAGVHIYVDGEEKKLNVLFDQCIWPIDTKEPFRIGAGGGLRFQGAIRDVRVYTRALAPEEARIVPLRDSLSAIAAIPPQQRTFAQRDKLRLAFLDQYAPQEVRELRARIAQTEKDRQAFLDTVPTVMVMADSPTPRDAFVLKRGAYDAHGEKVFPRTPAALPPFREGWPANRLGLAQWLVDRGNPLTARVTVNRFWQMLFGTGIVKTVEDFGSQGEWPANAELLDWLAVEFMDSGWDVKHIVKTMVMSAAYRQSSKATPELLEKDPENRLLARGPRFRLPPEVIRDEALAWSGLLVEKVGGPSVRPYQPPGLWQELQGGKDYQPDQGEGLYRRSLYTYWRRTVAPPSMVIFDSPSRETCVVRETRTNTPLQALNLMNDTIYLEASRKLAERMLGEPRERRLADLVEIVLARPVRDGELRVLRNALETFETYYSENEPAAEAFLKHGDSARDPRHRPSELAAYTAVASLVMNMDEAITKE
jgi:hypothetical protein